MQEKGKEVMQIRKERKKGREKERPRQNKSSGNLVQAKETELLVSTHRNSPGCQKTGRQSIEWSGNPTLR